MAFTILLIESLIISSLLFLYLNIKSDVGLRHLFTDNLIIATVSTIFSYLFNQSYIDNLLLTLVLNIVMVPTLLGLTILIRIYRMPHRKTKAKNNDIVSPADGAVVYIKRIEAHNIPLSVKNSVNYNLTELAEMDILKAPYWLVGINVTPFDTHKNAAPISGNVVMNKHFIGEKPVNNELLENERNTIVIDNGKVQVGVIQIASKKGKNIEIYIEENETVNRGDWFGMIKFRSQVDIIFPATYQVELNIKDQVYAGKSIVATK